MTGITTDGKPVIAGLFSVVGTHGLPLEILVEECHERGIAIDMLDFIRDARADGWKDRTIISRFSESRWGSIPEFMSKLRLALGAP